LRAVVASSPERAGSEDKLWLRYPKGQLHAKPWYIRIVEELEVEQGGHGGIH